jgi:23S rRNA (uracil1939-C5)-methyltransferase
MNTNLQINDLILLSIKRIGINGEGIGYYKRLTVFVEGALVGEEVEVIITERKAKYAIGKITRIKKKSPHRVEPPYPILLECGGCTMQIMTYKEQLKQKKNMLMEAFKHYYRGNLAKTSFSNMIGAKDIWGYRNKTQLPVRHDGEKVVVGMYQHGTNRLIYLDDYPLETPLIQKVMKEILTYLTESSINIYNPRFRQGNLRNIVIRGFEETGEVQVTFVLIKKENRLLNILRQVIRIENVRSVNYTINSDPKSFETITGEIHTLAGEAKIKGKLGHLNFLISPTAFFQLNTRQALVLYDEIIKAADFKGHEKVLDLYCGIGSIGLYLAHLVEEVRGIDNNEENIKDATNFASINDIQNAKFYSGEILPFLYKFEKEGFIPDVLIVDPPRRGMELSILNYLQKSKIKKIIYVSCNPSTLTKNLDHLSRSYEINSVVPIDLFPNTPHVECVVLMSRK